MSERVGKSMPAPYASGTRCRTMRRLVRSLVPMWCVLAVAPAWSDAPARGRLMVTIAAPDYWCPYACNAAGARSGFTVDIARAALESRGHEVVYRNLPYDRALVEAKTGRIDATMPTFKGEAPDFIFPSHAVSLTEYCFYVSQGNDWRYQGLESLSSIRFVATSGYTYGQEMDNYIIEHQDSRATLIRGSGVSGRLRELVQRGRYHALLDDRLLFESGENRSGLVNAGCLDERHPGYLALSPESPERSENIARAFELGMEDIQKSGELCEILDRYEFGAEFVPGVEKGFCRLESPE